MSSCSGRLHRLTSLRSLATRTRCKNGEQECEYPKSFLTPSHLLQEKRTSKTYCKSRTSLLTYPKARWQRTTIYRKHSERWIMIPSLKRYISLVTCSRLLLTAVDSEQGRTSSRRTRARTRSDVPTERNCHTCRGEMRRPLYSTAVSGRDDRKSNGRGWI